MREPAPTPIPSGRLPAADPQADRVLLLPTAYTHPAGTFYFTSYDVVLLQAGYAITDSTQVTLTALPIPNEEFTVLDLSLKTVLARTDLVRVAALGSASGAAGRDIGAVFIGRAGAVVQLCWQVQCESSFSISSNAAFIGPVVMMANGIGGIQRLSRRTSLLAELATLTPIGTQGGRFNGATLGGGVRFRLVQWGFDLTLVRPLDSDSPPLPVFTVTYRSICSGP